MRFLSIATAMALLIAACSGDPETAKRKYLASGNTYVDKQMYAEAIVEYRNALKRDPRFGEAHLRLAEAYSRTADQANAYREYVKAAQAIGASNLSRMFHHILPNVSHVALVQLSQHTVGFIKAEVILSFLGLGVPVDQVSWGTMLSEAQAELVLGHWWQLAAATLFMATFVTAFSLFTDALRDALDPKLR